MKTIESLQQAQDKPTQRPLSEEELTRTNQQLQEQLAETSRLLAQTQAELAELQQSQQLLQVSEIKFRTMYEITSDAVMLLDETGFIDCNNATLKLFGYTSREQFLKTNPAEQSPPLQPDGRDSKIVSAEYLAAAKREGSYRFEWIHRRTDGRLFPSEVTLTVINLPGKQIFQASIQDITARKQVEESLRENEALYQSSIDSLPQNIYRIDRTGRIIFGNKAYLSTLGLTMKECYGKTAYDFYPQELADKYTADDRHVMQTGEILDVVESHQLPLTGEITYVHVIKAPIRDSSGEIIGLQAIFWDVTKRIRAEQTVAKRATELETVAQVSTTISTILDLPQLLQNVVKLTQRHFDLYHCQIFMTDETGETLQVKASGWKEGDPHAGTTGNRLIAINQEQSLVARAARTGRPVMVNEVQADPGWLPNPLLPDTRSELAAPIIKGEQILGVLDVQSEEPNHFIAEDEVVMSTLAAQVAAAIQNANLFEAVTQAQAQAEERLRQTQIVQQLTQDLTGTLQVDEVIKVFLQACNQMLGFDYVMLSLVDKSQQRIRAVAGVNVSDHHLQRANHPLDSADIMADIIRTGQTEIITGWDPRFDRESFSTEGIADWGVRIFTPITLRDEHVGLVEVGFKQNVEVAIRDAQFKLLRNLTDQTALALTSAQRYEASQRAAQREQLLRELTARIRGSADVDTVMRTAAREVGQALGRPAFVYLGTTEEQQTPPLVEKEEASNER